MRIQHAGEPGYAIRVKTWGLRSPGNGRRWVVDIRTVGRGEPSGEPRVTPRYVRVSAAREGPGGALGVLAFVCVPEYSVVGRHLESRQGARLDEVRCRYQPTGTNLS